MAVGTLCGTVGFTYQAHRARGIQTFQVVQEVPKPLGQRRWQAKYLE